MKRFPGKVESVKEGRYRKLVLNDEQKEWLMTWFPVTENSRLIKAMGIGMTKLHKFSHDMGLAKSEKGLKAIRKRRDKVAARSNELNGCYDRKRGHPVSEATMAGCARRWEEERLGIRENGILRMKRENPKKYNEMIRKRSEERKESIRKEKMRLLYGLERKTKLRPVVLVPFKRSQAHHRRSALLRGYILTEDCSEGNPDRYIIYYDKLTERSERFEKNCLQDGFKIREWVELC